MTALLLRCDASTEMGTGHFFRMLALGQAARERGLRAELVCSMVPDKLLVQARHAGVPVAQLTPAAGTEADAAALISRMEYIEGVVGVVVDGYHFLPEYYRQLADVAEVVAAVDDVGRQPFPVDVLVNVNPHALQIEYEVPADCVCLLGPDFAFLRRQFRQLRKQQDERGRPDTPSVATRVLVSLGGGDPTNETGKVLRALQIAGFDGRVDVVVGPANSHREELDELAVSLDATVRVRSNVTDMARVMSGQHLAICAAGGTSWELACLGVPMLQIVIAENQMRVAEELASRGVAVLAGFREEVSAEQLAAELSSVLPDRDRRATMTARGRELVDGRGAFRVVESLRERAALFGSSDSVRSGMRYE